MDAQLISRLLWKRGRLRRQGRWPRRRLEEHQRRALHRLREHAYARSPFYRRFHKGLTDRPLGDLPVLTKETVLEHFDELVTDPAVRLADVEAHLATLSGGDELLGGRYRVAATSVAREGEASLSRIRMSGPPSWPPTTAPSTGLA